MCLYYYLAGRRPKPAAGAAPKRLRNIFREYGCLRYTLGTTQWRPLVRADPCPKIWDRDGEHEIVIQRYWGEGSWGQYLWITFLRFSCFV